MKKKLAKAWLIFVVCFVLCVLIYFGGWKAVGAIVIFLSALAITIITVVALIILNDET